LDGGNSYLAKNRNSKFFYGYIIILVTFAISVVCGGVWVILGIFFEPMLTEFGWTRVVLSGVYSLWIFLLTLFGIGVGRLTDKFGPRSVVTACSLFLGLGFFLMSRISAIWQLYLIYGVILGIGMSGLWIPVIATVARWFAKRRGMIIGIVLSGVSVGMIIVPPLATRLIITYGWRTSYIAIGIVAMIVAALAAQFMRRDPAQVGQLLDGGNELKAESLDLQTGDLSLREAVHTRQFWMLCGIFGCLWFSTDAIFIHIVIHAIDLGIPVASAANILAIIGGASIAGRLVIGSIADRIGHRPALLMGFTLLIGSFLWLLEAKELWALYLFAVIFGFGFSGLGVLESPLIAKLFGLASLGIILGSIEFVSMGFGVISPILAGHIFDITGSYQLAFLICATISIIGLILSLLLRPTSGR